MFQSYAYKNADLRTMCLYDVFRHIIVDFSCNISPFLISDTEFFVVEMTVKQKVFNLQFELQFKYGIIQKVQRLEIAFQGMKIAK